MGNSIFTSALVIGIIVGLVIVVFVMKFINRDGKMKTEYDERQKAVRGQSYMFGFYGLTIANVIMLVIRSYDAEIIRVLGLNAFFIPILVGIVVQMSHAIFNDSYMGMNNNMTRYIVVMAFVSVINFASGILPLVAGEVIDESGELYPQFINLEVGVLFIIVCIEMIIKKCINKKADAE